MSSINLEVSPNWLLTWCRVFWFTSLEKCCHAQMMADAAAAGRGGATIKIDEEDAAFTYKSVGTPRAGWFSALPAFEVMERECGQEVYN